MKHNIKKLVLIALFCALVAVGTIVINIPVPVTQGFINFGDSIIFVASALLGPIGGMLAGAIGSSMADVLLGYAHWAPFTFLIKGLEGLVCGAILQHLSKERNEKKGMLLQLLAFCIGGLVMMGGYYLAGGVLYGFIPALTELAGNGIQASVSILVGMLLMRGLSRVNLPFGE